MSNYPSYTFDNWKSTCLSLLSTPRKLEDYFIEYLPYSCNIDFYLFYLDYMNTKDVNMIDCYEYTLKKLLYHYNIDIIVLEYYNKYIKDTNRYNDSIIDMILEQPINNYEIIAKRFNRDNTHKFYTLIKHKIGNIDLRNITFKKYIFLLQLEYAEHNTDRIDFYVKYMVEKFYYKIDSYYMAYRITKDKSYILKGIKNIRWSTFLIFYLSLTEDNIEKLFIDKLEEITVYFYNKYINNKNDGIVDRLIKILSTPIEHPIFKEQLDIYIINFLSYTLRINGIDRIYSIYNSIKDIISDRVREHIAFLSYYTEGDKEEAMKITNNRREFLLRIGEEENSRNYCGHGIDSAYMYEYNYKYGCTVSDSLLVADDIKIEGIEDIVREGYGGEGYIYDIISSIQLYYKIFEYKNLKIRNLIEVEYLKFSLKKIKDEENIFQNVEDIINFIKLLL